MAAENFHYLLHPYNTSLVTCCDENGKPNIITIAWLMPVSINPPLLSLAIRTSRFSYALMKTTGEFVVNIAAYEIAQQSLLCGRRSGREVDKFAATGLTPKPARQVRPPIIEECLAHLECRLKQEVKAGDHQLIIGEVLEAYARPGILIEEKLYNLEAVKPLLHLGMDCFTTTNSQTIQPVIQI